MSKQTYRRCTAALLGLGLVLWLTLRCVGWVRLNSCKAEILSIESARQEALLTDRSWASYGPGCLVTTDADAHLVWTVDDTVSGLAMTLRSSRPVTQPELYYTTGPEQGFSTARRLTPVTVENGVYTFRFDLPAQVHQLRLDPTGAAGAFLDLQVTLNPAVSAGQWFCPTPAALAGVLALPPLAVLAAEIVVEKRAKGWPWNKKRE